MITKNLIRRRGRTLLTVLGISIGVAAIISLGALANGLEAGYDSMLSGSKADLVLSQPDAFDISMSAVDEEIGQAVLNLPEVVDASGMLQGIVQAEGVPYFYIFGFPEDSFLLGRFDIVEGAGLDSRQARRSRGRPLLLGSAAAEAMNKGVGDTLRIFESVFRIVGIYQTGGTLEDSGAVIRLRDAQSLLGRTRQVSLYYVRLRDPDLRQRFIARAERLWPDLSISSTEELANKQQMGDFMRGYVWAIAGLAIVIGGVGMMNAQLMSVMERTREIGVLRAVGWQRWRVLVLILGEALAVSLAGGLLGIGLGFLGLWAFSDVIVFFGATTSSISPGLLMQALVVVLGLALVGGLYPAWRAARLQPIEALRYEGGASGGQVRRAPIGGMATQSLWQRTGRTALTLAAISITVGAIIALEATVRGAAELIRNLSGGAEVMVRQAGIADTSFSALDERIGERISAMPEVIDVSGLLFTATVLPDSGTIFVIMGYSPQERAIQRFNVAEGERISTNHQIMLGRMMAEALDKKVGDSITLGGGRYRVVGIYESGVGWEEMGGIVTLRDAQRYTGRPRKVTMYLVDVKDPALAPAVVERINARIQDAHASLSGEFVEQMPDMQATDAMINGISVLAIIVGGLGVMNTMLMSVLERTREIGVLRAVGWKRRAILSLILREGLLLGVVGGLAGILVAFGLVLLMGQSPIIGEALTPRWELPVFLRAIVVALVLGLVGGLYPAFRATRLQPVEALRYE